MTTRIAIYLTLVIVAVGVVDYFWLDLHLPFLAATKLDALIEWLAFWR